MDVVVPIFVASLLGSGHCAAMCGPFVAFYAGQGPSKAPHLAYHLGRLATYVLLGAAAGYLGTAVDSVGSWLGVQRVAAYSALVLMIGWGLGTLLQSVHNRPALHLFPASWQAFVSKRVANLRNQPPILRGLFLGLLTTLMPCGWLYLFVVTAAGTANPWRGALTMAVFWSGSVPLLLGLGLFLARLSVSLRRYFVWATSIALIGIGAFGLWQRVSVGRAVTNTEQASCHAHK